MRDPSRKGLAVLPVAWLLLSALLRPTLAEDPQPIKVKWAADWREIEFTFQDETCRWPEDVVNATFPPPGAEPEFKIEKKWPVVALRTRWTIPLGRLPSKYRSQIRDLILMYACDAKMYQHNYPQVIRSSAYRCPKEFIAEAKDPFGYDLAEALRGKLVAYTITANAGFGAPDYTIETAMRIGVSRDGKTVFYHDTPDTITAHLKSRDYLAAFHISNDNLYCEGRMLCICTRRFFFRGEQMRRVASSGQYFSSQLYHDFLETRDEQQIADYLDLVKNDYAKVGELAQKHKDAVAKVLP